MPARILRDGILTSDRVNRLTFPAEVFYRRLMSAVDDFGRFDARPAILRAHLYPLRLEDAPEADVCTWLAECISAGLVVHYAVDNRAYLELTSFRQQVRARASKCPAPPEGTPAPVPQAASTRTADAQQTLSTRTADAQQMLNPCTADAQQMLNPCTADAHSRARAPESETNCGDGDELVPNGTCQLGEAPSLTLVANQPPLPGPTENETPAPAMQAASPCTADAQQMLSTCKADETPAPDPEVAKARSKRDAIRDDWNEIAKRYGLPQVRDIHDERWKQWKRREAEGLTLQAADNALESSDTEWLANGKWLTFDWLTKNGTNWRKLVEGNYSGQHSGDAKIVRHVHEYKRDRI